MTRDKMIEMVDQICDDRGYEDSPAYDQIYSECVAGRRDEDATEMIRDMLKKYNQ